METVQLVDFNKISYKQFEKFIDSLDEEKNTWSLDRQGFKNNEDYFNYQSTQHNLVLLHGDKVIGLFLALPEKPEYKKIPEHIKVDDNFDDIKHNIICWLYSYVIKKEYQKNNLATGGLKALIEIKDKQSEYFEWDKKVNLIIHTARTHTYNLGSRFLLKKLGFSSVHKYEEQITYCMIKDNVNNKIIDIKNMYDSDLIRR
tara:strand:- start:680 stop:1282 length:603 start_codon:yes stop_codon:yes gene_type:complete